MLNSKLSFFSATLINVNIVVGSAFLLGASTVSQQGGFAAPLAWILCAALLLPLVFIFSHFARIYPEAGGIYLYSEKKLGRFWGYIGAWLYFLGTVAGNALVLRGFVGYFHTLSRVQDFCQGWGVSILALEIFFAVLFAVLSVLNVQFFERAQFAFSILKFLPFFVLAVGAILLFSPSVLATATVVTWDSFMGTLPMVFFAFTGLEACSAIIHKVQGGEKNGWKVILISFAITAAAYTFAQLLIVGMFGQSTQNPFLSILPQIMNNQILAVLGNKIVYVSILLSFLGGFYAMYYINSWNLFAIAKDESIFGFNALQKLNHHNAPWVCVAIQTVLLIIMLVGARSDSLLVTMADFGVVLAYLLTAVAFMRMCPGILGGIGIFASLLLAGFSLHGITASGWMVTLPFWAFFLLGLFLYRRSSRSNTRLS